MISPQGTGYRAEFARLLKALDVGTVTPAVLALRERLDDDSAELKQACGDLASYPARRSVCGLTTKGYNRFFCVCCKPSVPEKLMKHCARRRRL